MKEKYILEDLGMSWKIKSKGILKNRMRGNRDYW
jgi:hypothetical protein